MLPFRRATRHAFKPPRTLQARSLVSYLMNRSYENDTVAQLKLEAKERGLSQTGNKATLITKLQEHDKSQATQQEMQVPTSILQNRNASTAAAPPTPTPTTPVPHPVTKLPASAAPAAGSVAPGIPPEAQVNVKMAKTPLTHIYMPDISQPPPEEPVQVPYLPDFWDSMKTRKAPSGETDTTGLSTENAQPKMVVVAGGATHHGGGPSHNAHTGPESTERHLELPTVKEISQASSGVMATVGLPPIGIPEAASDSQKLQVRDLYDDEKTGLYWLLGGTITAWLISGLLTPTSKVDKKDSN